MRQSSQKLTTLLVATDLSRGGGYALERAVRLPLANGAELHLLHVLPEGMPSPMRGRAEESARVQLGRAASAAAEAALGAGRVELSITPKVICGEAYVEIIRNARRVGAELVVTGRLGKRGLKRLLIGSTAMRVIRKGDLPVLVVCKDAATAYQRPLVAIGLEDSSRGVLDLAFRVVDPALKPVPVLHAYWPPFEGSILAKLSPKELEEYHREFKRKAETALKQILSSLPDKGARCKPVVVRGDPRSVVLEEAGSREADLVAVGTHARAGVSHALLGSVAEWLITHARCDVLVARPTRITFRLP